MAELDAAGEGKRSSAAANDLSKFIEIWPRGSECKHPMHTSVLEGVNNKQSDKAHGIWDLGTQNTFF